jgi:ABC-type branched-subunit amino acid transport system substrate-binding protein
MPARLRIGACLSLTGRFASFGRQAAAGLDTWVSLTGAADIVLEDDRSDRRTVEQVLPGIARRCDLVLGPYSTVLARAAGDLAAEHGWLVWNQGGSGDDVEQAHPGHVVSVLTPTSRYGAPFVRLLAADDPRAWLIVQHAPGAFGRQVAEGATRAAHSLGIGTASGWLMAETAAGWNLLSAGVFEDDVELVAKARMVRHPPTRICAVAAGVRQFADAVEDPDGIYGIAQWFPGSSSQPELGPAEAAFLRAYADRTRSAPDYPAVQAAAGAIIATHCAQLAGSTSREDLWQAAASLNTSTLFGAFRIDERGVQTGHETVLLRWARGQLAPASEWLSAAS